MAEPAGERSYERPRPNRESWLQNFNKEIAKDIREARAKGKPLPYIPQVTVNVFGFSRGSAQAAAFCHWLHAALIDGKIAGIPVTIGFVGLFDCVASIGLADSARRATGAAFADGHFDWAKEILNPLPALVKRVVHFVAAHEQRLNFPLTRIRASGEVLEYVYPGMHSDVGGGYGLLSQGRSASDGELLSQIPLMHMHREARAAGVPLVMPSEMASQRQKDYELSESLARAWNSYMAALDTDYRAQQTTLEGKHPSSIADCHHIHTLVRQHMRLYYAVRREYLGNMQEWIRNHVSDATVQDEEDITSYNEYLAADLRLSEHLREELQRRPNAMESRVVNDFLNEDQNKTPPVNKVLWHVLQLGEKALPADRQWIDEVAGPVLSGRNSVQAKDFKTLVLKYVHDSLAGFYLAGYSTLEEKSMKLVEVLNKADQKKQLNAHEQQLLDNYKKVSERNKSVEDLVDGYRKARNAILKSDLYPREKELALRKFDKERTFTSKENKEITSAKPLIFPKVLTDADAKVLLEDGLEKTAVSVISDGRREGGGYLLPRAIFPLTE